MTQEKSRVIYVDFQRKKRIEQRFGYQYVAATDYERGLSAFFESLRTRRVESQKGITSWPFGGGVDQHED